MKLEELPCAGKPAEAANDAFPSTKAGATTLFVEMMILGFTIGNSTPLAYAKTEYSSDANLRTPSATKPVPVLLAFIVKV